MLLSSRNVSATNCKIPMRSLVRAKLLRRSISSIKGVQGHINREPEKTEESDAEIKAEGDSIVEGGAKKAFVKNINLKDLRNSHSHSIATNGSSSTLKNVSDQKQRSTTRLKGVTAPRKFLVPMVPSTDYISIPDIQTEALYAGHRPLFLGNSTLQDTEYLSKYQPKFQLSPDLERELIDTFKKLVRGDDSGAKQFLKRLLKMPPYKILKKMDAGSPISAETPIVPWMASISGLLYRDTPFKNIPNHVVAKLKPFELNVQQQVETTECDKSLIKPTRDTIVMKVHNPRINDEPEMVNIYNPPPMVGTGYSTFQPNSRNFYNQNGIISQVQNRARYRAARKQYMSEVQSLSYKYKFIVDDQLAVKNAASKINEHLSDIFYERTKLNGYSEVRGRSIPFYMYLYSQNNMRSRRSFERFMKKVMMKEVTPIYTTLLGSFKSDVERQEFERQTLELISKTAKDLIQLLPSVVFRDPTQEVECIIRNSPVPGFKRMYWLDPIKRRATFSKKNADLFFTWQLSVGGREESETDNHRVESVARPFTLGRVVKGTASKYKMEPNNISWETLSGAFDNWNFYTN